MRPSTPVLALKRARRIEHIANVLAKHGFGSVLTHIHIWEAGFIDRRILHREPRSIRELTLGQRIRLAIEELGPTFIKLGQMLSTRPDLVPPDIIFELKKLQSSVHFVPTEVVRHIIESELKHPIDQIFDSFEDKPLAAASLAQVHRAVLRGKPVVLKVQRPNSVEICELDVDIMRSLASLAERYSSSLYMLNSVGLVEEFGQQLKKELDFLMEAQNTGRFARNFAGDETIHVPEVYPDFCTRRLVTMEYLDGIRISDTRQLSDRGYDLQLIAKRGAVLGYKAIFEHGFFHADPHPGNILILPDNVIGLVDYGMMAHLSNRERERLAKLVYFISQRDDTRVARALNELMESEDVISAENLESSMSAIIGEYSNVRTCDLKLAGMLFAMMRSIMAHGGRLRPQLIWITKSIASQEEMACSLNADFNLMEIGKPHAQKLLSQKLNPVRHSRGLYNWLVDALDLMKDLPYDAGIILRELRKGRIKIEFEHVGLEPLRKTLNSMTNRQALTNIIVALLISSSLVVLAKLPPFVAGIPLLSFIGYIVAVILGLILFFNILLQNRR